jgi:hypothetical protein
MDDNTTKVLLAAIVLVFLFACIRRFDRVSLRLERLSLNIVGLLKLGTGALELALQRKPLAQPSRIPLNGDMEAENWQQAFAPYLQGSSSISSAIQAAAGHGIDMFILTHPDRDHQKGLQDFIRVPHHGRRS